MEIKNKFNIDFIGIGAPKCGTTWLAQCLSEHPDIYIPSQKEVNYFHNESKVDNYHKGIQWYQNFFSDAPEGSILGEYTTHYMYHKSTEKLIHNDFPDVKLIVSLRNPAEMLYSLYKWEKANFESYNISDNFEDVLKENSFYIERGHYFKYLEPYYKFFDRSKIHVILFDEIKEDSSKVLKSVYEFLGVKSDYNPPSKDTRVNSAKKPRSKMLSILASKTVKGFESLGLDQISHDMRNSTKLSNLYEKLNKKKAEYKPMTPELKKELNDNFKDDISKLEKLIGKDLSAWK